MWTEYLSWNQLFDVRGWMYRGPLKPHLLFLMQLFEWYTDGGWKWSLVMVTGTKMSSFMWTNNWNVAADVQGVFKNAEKTGQVMSLRNGRKINPAKTWHRAWEMDLRFTGCQEVIVNGGKQEDWAEVCQLSKHWTENQWQQIWWRDYSPSSLHQRSLCDGLELHFSQWSWVSWQHR